MIRLPYLLPITCYLLLLSSALSETTFSGTFRSTTTWQHTKTVGASTLNETLPTLFVWTHENGTGFEQMNAFASSSAALAAGATNTVSLGAAVNGFGDVVAFIRVAFLAVRAAASNSADIVVGGAPAGAFESWASTAGATFTVKPGGLALFIAPSTNGYAVGTSTNLMIRNASTATNAAYDLYIGGAK